jgi:hypothetical protein
MDSSALGDDYEATDSRCQRQVALLKQRASLRFWFEQTESGRRLEGEGIALLGSGKRGIEPNLTGGKSRGPTRTLRHGRIRRHAAGATRPPADGMGWARDTRAVKILIIAEESV